jgi:CheY-like chemotaxis protein
MPKGGTLTIAARNVTIGADVSTGLPELTPGDYVCLGVRDTGAGIPPDIISRVFEPFFTTKAGGHGTGMGLSMVYGFVKQSGGDVAIQSENGRGTTVMLYFPRDRSDRAVERRATGVARTARPRGSERILLVEDDPRLRERTANALTRMGYRVSVAANGAEALSMLEREPSFDLLFTDIVMPGPLNGVDLAQKAGEIYPALRLLFMTGYAERSEQLSHFLVAGTRILTKPFTTEQLSQTVRNVLSH